MHIYLRWYLKSVHDLHGAVRVNVVDLRTSCRRYGLLVVDRYFLLWYRTEWSLELVDHELDLDCTG
eukprot:SAG11_NODE_1592_length_4617_cov_6.925631_6_plen_66_part_00